MAEHAEGPGSSSRTSRSLIQRVKNSESDAWERLVNLYSPLVYYWCQESGLPRQDLHDVFQEVFHSLARNIQKFRPMENGTFRGWLRTMTRNKVNDFFRKNGREPRPVGGTEAKNYLDQIPAGGPGNSAASNPDHFFGDGTPVSAEFVIQQAMLQKALENIRPSFHEQTWKAFWMVVVDGRETADVAGDLSMRPGTIRVAKSRVLKRLRQEIGDSIE